MLDIKLIRKDANSIEKRVKEKEPSATLAPIIALDDKMRQTITALEQLQADRNSLSKEVGKRKKEGLDATEIMARVKEITQKSAQLSEELRTLEEELKKALAHIPNLAMDDVKVSQDVEENVCIKVVGEKPTFSFEPKNHLELNERLGLLEFEKTAKTSGSGWPAYKGVGAQLEWALLNYMIELQVLNGFEFWLPPLLVQPEMMYGSGQMPKFEGQFYEVKGEHSPLYLLPTAEVVLNGLHAGEIIEESQLPLKYAAYTPCFRKEAGAHGAQERGLIRVHQFNKVEMFCFTTPEQSIEIFDKMIATAEEILQGLGLHYRLMNLVTGDMSFTAAKTVDVEVWMPGQKRYFEVSSISNCTDYQARRSHIRYRKTGGKPELVHTLNGSGLATPRLMVALLEHYQDAEGNIHLPPLLAEKLNRQVLTP